MDAFHAEIGSKLPSVGPLEAQPWGMREVGITTPDGHRITIGQIVKGSP